MNYKVKKDDIIKSAYQNMIKQYGEDIPLEIRSRFENERIMLANKEALIYLDILKNVKNYAADLGHAVYNRGDIASSFISYLLGATDINPLPPHYYCPVCHKVEFADNVYDAWDLPNKQCECRSNMNSDGHNLNFELCRIAFGDLADYSLAIPEESFDAIVSKIKDELGQYFICEQRYFEEVKSVRLFASCNKSDESDNNSFSVVVSPTLTLLNKMRKNIGLDVSSTELTDNLFSDIGIFGCSEFQEIIKFKKPARYSDLLKFAGLTMGSGTWNDSVKESLNDEKKIIAFRDDIYDLIKYALNKKGIQDIGLSHTITTRTTRGLYNRFEELFRSDKQLFEELEIPKSIVSTFGEIKYLMPKAHVISIVKMSILLTQIQKQNPAEFKNHIATLGNLDGKIDM